MKNYANTMDNNDIIFRQLTSADIISDKNSDIISDLIYKTDQYIYPCLFGDMQNARLILRECLRSGLDGMFNKQNLFIAEYNDAVIGIILWLNGPLKWDPEYFRSLFDSLNIQIPAYYEKVVDEYLCSYSDADTETISIVNVCVDEAFRSHSIGFRMMSAFISQHKTSNMELLVLEENKSAVGLYTRLGFKQTGTLNGFSWDSRQLPCISMERKAYF